MKIIVIGVGEVGFHVASRLSHENKDVVVIDTDADAIRRVSDNLDVQVLQGSGSNPRVLREAGIEEAEILLAVTSSDEINLVACLVSNLMSPSTKKLARIREADFDPYHEAFSSQAPRIDTIINPEIELVKTIDRLMSVPGAVDVGEFEEGRVKLIGIKLGPDTPFANVRLSELPKKIGKQTPLIAAILRDERLIIPRGDDCLMAGDTVYFVSEEQKLSQTLEAFGNRFDPIRRVMIIGGGRIGLRLAKLLEEKSIQTKLIEKNAERCSELAEQLNKTVVLHGDGTDQAILSEEGIQEMDVVVTLADDEQTNVLASLLARRLGARKAITRINSFRYFPIMSAIGIEQVVSPRLSAINSILHHIRRGKVLSSITIKGEQAEVIEAVALETSDIVGKPLKKVAFPREVLVTIIIRDDHVIIPSGESVIVPGDRVIIFGTRQAIPKLEKILAVKLEYF
ncbi:MAG: Trk system potassium transporter TrkA [Deltaproteobacteria bacterium]|nr:Trk system potassium transporter TrkA [Deltaproteobacteria bacterium]MBW1961724.1 Trk system potassium transporter TrkA [Deltaproteobacteria bacterium]MBW1994312.1 Trk system potassium transporter TrkA [Deltaproteobacteria bacterium]MBW2153788.1 Trk system potassium transporter TrkA [Deltaproteobacteria bacterium]